MAILKISDKQVTVELDWWEKLAAHRSHLKVPLRAISDVSFIEDVFSVSSVTEGQRHPATRIRGVTSTGTLSTEEDTSEGETIFAVCHGSKPRPGLMITLDKATVDRIIITSPCAQRYVNELEQAIRGGSGASKSAQKAS